MHEVASHAAKILTVDDTASYHMTTFRKDLCAAPPRVSPHAGTEVWSPDALVPGVSPMEEGLGMVETSRSDPVQHLSNFVRTAPPFVGRIEEGTRPCLPFAEILQALLDRSSLEIARTLSTNLQHRAESHGWTGLAHRWDHALAYRRAHDQEPVKAYRRASTIYQSNTEFPPVLRCTRS
jgi:hypothetical protein